VLVASILAVGALAGVPAPPVLHESFTRLPCPPHPQTTVAIEGCIEKAIVATDSAINKQVKKIFVLLPTAGARQTFVRSEKDWVAYRESSCSAQTAQYAGGTLQPLDYAYCVQARNKTHLLDLAALRKSLR
jgi:uncharacterized protein YecT (DUF1311 family)